MCHLGMVKITTNVSHGACQIAVMYVSRNYSCDGWSESRGAAAFTFLSKVIIQALVWCKFLIMRKRCKISSFCNNHVLNLHTHVVMYVWLSEKLPMLQRLFLRILTFNSIGIWLDRTKQLVSMISDAFAPIFWVCHCWSEGFVCITFPTRRGKT